MGGREALKSIGIILNPFSGKDLRRVTSNASIVTNQEKVNKVFRMILSMNAFPIDRVYLMPDVFSVNDSVVERAKNYDDLKIDVRVLDFEPLGNYLDTMRAAEEMEAAGVGCIIVLGGDGTNRLVSRTDIHTPIISISTGTNNAYPEFWEGTTVGIAASYLTLYPEMVPNWQRGKRIEILKNDEKLEVAIVDAVITSISNIGTKVVKDIDDIEEVVVCLSKPQYIGFSSLVGSLHVCRAKDDFGYRMRLKDPKDAKGKLHHKDHEKDMHHAMAPINSGELTPFSYDQLEKMELGEEYVYVAPFNGTVALDGERTMTFLKGDVLKFSIVRNGLRRVSVDETLRIAVENGFLRKGEA